MKNTATGKKSRESIFWAFAAILSLVALWQLISMATQGKNILPPPFKVFAAFLRAFAKPIGKHTLPSHLGYSLMRVVVGYAIATVTGIGLGLGMGWSRMTEAIVKPIFELFRPIPPLAWIPMGILWFGIGENTKYFIIFIATFMTITLNAYRGARNVDPVLIGAARMLGASERQIFFHIVMPSSVPQIFAGLQVALSSGWMAVLAAEMVRSSEGAGWIIIRGMETGNTVQILVGMISIGIVGFLIATAMREAERRLCAWNVQGR
jgi:NitT/TauT family transport system permease protein/sulfonate transport system permease protein